MVDHGSSVVFFDLDRTLTGEISGNALIRAAWDEGMISMTDILRASFLYLVYKLQIRDPLKVIDSMAGWTRGKSVEELENLCRKTFDNILYPSVYKQAEDELRMHRSEGRRILLLSSALDQICRLMAEQTALDGWLCSTLESKDGFLTGKPVGSFCFGVEKLKRLTGYCNAEGFRLEDAWFYSDSLSDLPALSAVGTPVCVNPDRGLRREAGRRQWKILEWDN
jgi:HAD superfamily hydrolase (TIGR01490 family)